MWSSEPIAIGEREMPNYFLCEMNGFYFLVPCLRGITFSGYSSTTSWYFLLVQFYIRILRDWMGQDASIIIIRFIAHIIQII